MTSVEDIERTAGRVVGPEPFEGSSQEDAKQSHWAYLNVDTQHRDGWSHLRRRARRRKRNVLWAGVRLTSLCRTEGMRLTKT
jgi:hypothetical protein